MQRQLEAIRQNEAAFRERDMRRLVVTPEGAQEEGEALPEGAAKALRERFGPKSGHLVLVLVGKDGGEKMRARGLIEMRRFFERIDQMPMRRREMRRDR